ncbi:hypothetical protein ABD91_21375 [Lysinibacillus sphaericus]|uniref:hypothetical protein n=1 Tax=Lysinibacillus sphaericus TaxID=1421 RepID=UPI0018CFE23C|nr:hypothetical protein [Lysinibacillus sphaericus]MBG9693289.1 hypothetical protein [Lysinibacillus sphaericus]
MPKVNTDSLKRLAKNESNSLVSGALVESAEYIAELESEMFDYKRVVEEIAFNDSLNVSDTVRHIAKKALNKYN